MTEGEAEDSALTLLVSGYLNLDWPEDYGDAWRAVEDFLASEPPDSARELADEIAALLSTERSEADLTSYLVDTLGSGYLPEGDGWTSTKSWLEAVAHRAAGGSSAAADNR